MSDQDDVNALFAESGQDELWLVSYADLLTLLIGFFVLIIAGSGVKASSFERMSAALTGNQQKAPLAELKQKVDRMITVAALGDRVRAREDNEGLAIEFKDALLFDSGSAEVRKEGRAVIGDVARLLAELPDRSLVIEGHTDDVPIHTAVFDSNWDLSGKRAINVLLALEGSGVAKSRMSARAYADTRTASTNQDNLDARRAASRRVVIRVE